MQYVLYTSDIREFDHITVAAFPDDIVLIVTKDTHQEELLLVAFSKRCR